MASIVAFSTAIGPVPIDCVLSEKPSSELDITEISVETGAKITDHAVVLPKKVSLDIANEDGTASYNAIVAFQESRVPFTLVTGLAVFENMLVKAIYPERDASFSRILKARVELQEIILVGTAYVPSETGSNSARGAAGGAKSTRAAPASSDRASGIAAERAGSSVQRGDAAVNTAAPADRSFLSRTFGN